MELLESKENILQEVHKLFESYKTLTNDRITQSNEYLQEIKRLNDFTNKLLEENNEKDKLLSLNEKKMYDYECMINKIQEEENQKEKFSMLRTQDKEINLKNNEIKVLGKKVFMLEEKLKTFESNPINEVITEPKEEEKHNDIVKESEVITEPKEEEKNNDIVTDKGEMNETVNSYEDKDEYSSDEGDEYEEITHYKKKYLIKVGESPQYIYAQIIDGEDIDIGDIVGEIKDNKKVLYKDSKN